MTPVNCSGVTLVSHGQFAPGFKNALGMLARSDRDDIIAAGLEEDMGAEKFADVVKEKLEGITNEDEILLFGDILGGSPLTTAANVIAENDLLENTSIVGGVNLPFVITVALMKDTMDTDELIASQIAEAKDQIRVFELEDDSEEMDI